VDCYTRQSSGEKETTRREINVCVIFWYMRLTYMYMSYVSIKDTYTNIMYYTYVYTHTHGEIYHKDSALMITEASRSQDLQGES
jgi:hypothetical protein